MTELNLGITTGFFSTEKALPWPDNYWMAAEFLMEMDISPEGIKEACEVVFEKMNDGLPEDWPVRSMSVGDVVQIGEIAMLCDRMGWKEVIR